MPSERRPVRIRTSTRKNMQHARQSPEIAENPASDASSMGRPLDLTDPAQVSSAAARLGVGSDVLREAAKAFGPSLQAILTFLVLPR